MRERVGVFNGRTSIAAIATVLAGFPVTAPAFADGIVLPNGGQVVAGQAAIGGNGINQLTIDQTSARAVIDWRGFSIGQGGSVQFNNGSGATLNRVTGGEMSTIAGQLSATGSVYLINPSGIVIDTTGRVLTGGSFVASTRMIGADGFMAGGDAEFDGVSTNGVVNHGSIVAGGDAVLIGSMIVNDGLISAGGTGGLIAGNHILLRAAGRDERIMVDGGTGDVSNSGGLAAAAAELRAAGGNVFALAGNSGGIEAAGSASQNGRLWLVAGGNVSVSGALKARNADGSGGIAHVLGTNVALLDGASVDVSGTKGGIALIGGDYKGGADPDRRYSELDLPSARSLYFASGAVVRADGGTGPDAKGDGGAIVLWSDKATGAFGTISARGGAEGGDGGFVETSGHERLDFDAQVDTSAPKGRTGTLLLDPTDIVISTAVDSTAGGTTGGTFTAGTYDPGDRTSTVIRTSTLQTQLASNNVVINTSGAGAGNGDITIANPILTWSSGNSLTLNAVRDITVSAGVTITKTGANTPTVTFNAGSGGGAGNILFNTTAAFLSVTGANNNLNLVLNAPQGSITLTNGTTFAGATSAIIGVTLAASTGITLGTATMGTLNGNVSISNSTSGDISGTGLISVGTGSILIANAGTGATTFGQLASTRTTGTAITINPTSTGLLTFGGNISSSGGAIMISSGGGISYGSRTIGSGGGAVTISTSGAGAQSISGTGAITLGTGTITISNSSATGTTAFGAVSSTRTSGTAVTVNTTSTGLVATPSITSSSGANISLTSGGGLTMAGNITMGADNGGTALVISAAGTITQNTGTTITYGGTGTATATLTGGTSGTGDVTMTTTAAVSATGAGGILNYTMTAAGGGSVNLGTGNLAATGTARLNLTLTGRTGVALSSAGITTLDGNVAISNTTSGNISGTGAIASRLGSISIANAGTGSSTFGALTSTATSGTPITVNNTSTGLVTLGGNLATSGGNISLTSAGGLALNTRTIGTGGGTLALSVSGPGAENISGSGAITLGTGSMTVNTTSVSGSTVFGAVTSTRTTGTALTVNTTSTGLVTLAAITSSQGANISLTSGGGLTFGGNVTMGSDNGGTALAVSAVGTITQNTGTTLSYGGTGTATATLTSSAGNIVTLTTGAVTATGSGGTLNYTANATAAGSITRATGAITASNGALINVTLNGRTGVALGSATMTTLGGAINISNSTSGNVSGTGALNAGTGTITITNAGVGTTAFGALTSTATSGTPIDVNIAATGLVTTSAITSSSGGKISLIAAGALTLGGTTTIGSDNSGNALTVTAAGALGQANGVSITYAGTGTATASLTSTGSNIAFTGTAGTTATGSGGILNYSLDATAAGSVTLGTGATTASNGAMINVTVSGRTGVALASAAMTTLGGNIAISNSTSGNMTGSGALNSGTGTISISNAGSGTTGFGALTSTRTTGTAITINPTSTGLVTTGALTASGGAAISVNASAAALTLGGAVSATGGDVTLTTAGNLTLGANTIGTGGGALSLSTTGTGASAISGSGAITLGTGTVSIANSSATGTTAFGAITSTRTSGTAITVNTASTGLVTTAALTSSSGAGISLTSGGGLTLGGNVTLGDNNGGTALQVNTTGTITQNTGTTITYGGTGTATANLVAGGTGSVTLTTTAAVTATGSGGTLNFNANATAGGTINLGTGNLTASGGALLNATLSARTGLSLSSAAITTGGGNVAISNSTSGNIAGTGAIDSGTGTISITNAGSGTTGFGALTSSRTSGTGITVNTTSTGLVTTAAITSASGANIALTASGGALTLGGNVTVGADNGGTALAVSSAGTITQNTATTITYGGTGTASAALTAGTAGAGNITGGATSAITATGNGGTLNYTATATNAAGGTYTAGGNGITASGGASINASITSRGSYTSAGASAMTMGAGSLAITSQTGSVTFGAGTIAMGDLFTVSAATGITAAGRVVHDRATAGTLTWTSSGAADIAISNQIGQSVVSNVVGGSLGATISSGQDVLLTNAASLIAVGGAVDGANSATFTLNGRDINFGGATTAISSGLVDGAQATLTVNANATRNVLVSRAAVTFAGTTGTNISTLNLNYKADAAVTHSAGAHTGAGAGALSSPINIDWRAGTTLASTGGFTSRGGALSLQTLTTRPVSGGASTGGALTLSTAATTAGGTITLTAQGTAPVLTVSNPLDNQISGSGATMNIVSSGSVSFANAATITSSGSNSGTPGNINITASSGTLTLGTGAVATQGANLTLSSNDTITLNGALNLGTGGNVSVTSTRASGTGIATVNTIVTDGGFVRLATSGSNITIGNASTGSITATGSFISLKTSGAVTQGTAASLTSSGLLLGDGTINSGTYTLTHASNAFGGTGGTGTVAIRAATASVTSTNRYVIGTTDGVAGATLTGALTLTTTDATNTVSQSQAISAATLNLNGTGGTYAFGTQSNTVTTLTANTGGFDFNNAQALSLGALTASSTGTATPIKVSALGGNLTINGAISAQDDAGAAQFDRVVLFTNRDAVATATGTISPGTGSNRFLIYTNNPNRSVTNGGTTSRDDTTGEFAFTSINAAAGASIRAAGHVYNNATDLTASTRTAVAVTPTGNRFVYADQPTLIFRIEATTTKTYDGNAAAPAVNYQTGLVNTAGTGVAQIANGSTDVIGAAPAINSAQISGAAAYNQTNINVKRVGDDPDAAVSTYTGVTASLGTLASGIGYALAFDNSTTNTTTINPVALTVTGATAQDKIYDATTAATIAGASLSAGVIPADAGNVGLNALSGTFDTKNVGTGKAVTVTGTLLNGSARGNYSISDPAGLTAAVTVRTVNIRAVTSSKTYDGTTTSGGTPTVDATDANTGLVGGETLTATQTFNTAAASATNGDKTVVLGTPSGGNGFLNGNYTVNSFNSTGTINKAPLVVNIANKSKTYGGTDPALTFQVTGLVNSEQVSTALTGGFSGGGVGNSTTVTSTTALSRVAGESVGSSPYTISNGGGSPLTATSNYTIMTVNTGQLTINPATLTINASTNQSKVYGAADPGFTFSNSGLVNGDLIGDVFGGTLTRVAGESVGSSPYTINVGSGALVTTNTGNITNNTSNYSLVFNAGSFAITPATLTVTADAKSKVYGDSDPTLTFAVSGLVNSDTQGAVLSGVLSRNAGENVATGPYAITQGGVALTTTNGGNITGNTSNYTVNYVGADLTITARPVRVTAANDTKVYDSTTARSSGAITPSVQTGVTSEGLVGGDAFNALTQTFNNANVVGASSTIVTTPTFGTGTASNYNVILTSNTGTITARPLTLTGITVDDKTYNGTTAATFTGTTAFTAAGANTGLVGAQSFAITDGSFTFNTASAGSNKATTATGFALGTALGGAIASNYSLSQPTGLTANIALRPITISAVTDSKTYDGNATSGQTPTVASSTANTNLASGQTVFSTLTQSFDSPNASAVNGRTLAVNNQGAIVIHDGGNADVTSNYSFTYNTALGTINKKNITVSGVTAQDKIYNANTTAILGGTAVVTTGVGGQTFTVNAGSGTFDTKDVGTGKAVTLTGFSLGTAGGGADANNYNIVQQSGLTAAVTVRTVTANAVTTTKTYDGTTASANTPTVVAADATTGLVGGETLTGTQIFDSKNASAVNGRTLTVNSTTGGNGFLNGNYDIVTNTALGTINKKTINATGITADNKIYDATTDATFTGTAVVATGVTGETFDVSAGTVVFATNANVGTAKAVTASGFALTNAGGGADTNNYTFGQPTGLTANITIRPLTIRAVTDTKTYDGNATSAGSPTVDATVMGVSGLVGGDSVTGRAQVFDSANASAVNGRTMSVSAYTVNDGNSGLNYDVTLATALGTINKKNISVTGVTAQDKIYNATTAAILGGTAVVSTGVGGETFAVNAGTGTFNTKDVGTNKPVTLTGFALGTAGGGADANNYNIVQQSGLTAAVTVRDVTIRAVTDTKIYDNTTASAGVPTVDTATGTTGLVGGETLTGTQTFDSVNVSAVNGRTLTVTSTTPGNGFLNGNYNIIALTAMGTINAAAISLTYVVGDSTYVYGDAPVFGSGAFSANTKATLTGIIGGDDVQVLLGNLSVFQNDETTLIAAANAVTGTTLNASATTYKVKPVSLTLAGGNANNYIVTDVGSTAGNVTVTARPVRVTAAADTKVYNATTASAGTPSVQTGVTSEGLVGGDAFNALVQTFNDANVVGATTVNVTTPTFGTGTASNYNVILTSNTGTITARPLTLTGITVDDKTYNGTTAATFTGTTAFTAAGANTGLVGAQSFAITDGSFTFNTASAGSNKATTATGFALGTALGGAIASNYSLSQPTGLTANIALRPITISAVTDSKTYDGNATSGQTPTVASSTANTNLASGQTVFSTLTQSFDSPNASAVNGRTLAVNNQGAIVIHDGGNADVTSNYSFTYNDALGTITKKNITVTGVSADNKIYDNSLTATLSGTPAISTGVGGETFVVDGTGASAAFVTKNVATGITVNASGYVLGTAGGGANANNYTIAQPTGLSANITLRPITISAATSTKTYDGDSSSANAPTITVGTLASGESLNALTQTFDSANASAVNGRMLTAAAPSFNVGSSSNYSITLDTALGTINPKTVTITGLSALDKFYDGNTAATLTGTAAVSGLVGIETLGVGAGTGAFASANVNGANLAQGVTASGFSITNGTGLASNYSLTAQPMIANATIFRRTVTLTSVADTKIYDGNANSAITTGLGVTAFNAGTGAGFVSGEGVASFTQVFNTKDVATATQTNLTGTGAGFTLNGSTIANNYAISTATNTGTITAKSITATGITADNRVYDGTTNATFTGTPTVTTGVTGETFVVNAGTVAFGTSPVGTGKTVIASGFTLGTAGGGADANNYTFGQPTGLTANITLRPITISAVTDTKQYDGTTSSANTPVVGTATPTTNLATGQTISTTLTQAFGSKNVLGTNGSTLSVSSPGSIVIRDGGMVDVTSNYSISTPTALGTITAKALTLTGVNAQDKVYDGNTVATLTGGTLSGTIGGDAIAFNGGIGTFADKNVANAIVVTATGFALTGGDAGNYTLSQPTGLAANITPKTLTATLVNSTSKVYNGNAAATLVNGNYSVAGFVAGEGTSVTKTTGVYDTKNVGTGKGVSTTLTGGDFAANGGTSLSNYTLPTTAAGNIGIITVKALTITGATAQDKIYDATTAATVTGASIASGVEAGDDVTLGALNATFDTRNVGTGKAVTVTGASISGTDGGNYTVSNPSGLTAAITVRALTVNAVTETKVYDSTTASSGTPTLGATTGTTGLVGGDTVTGRAQTFSSANAGSRTLSVTAYTVNDGNGGANYAVTTATAPGTITAATLTVQGVDKTKVYNQTDPALTYTVAGLKGTDTATTVLSGVIARVTGEDVGTYAINQGTLTSNPNYSLVYTPGTFRITPATVTINYSVGNTTNVYGNLPTIGVTTLTGIASGDVVNPVYTITNAQNAPITLAVNTNVGVYGAAVTSLSGAQAGNYIIASTGNTNGTITVTPASLTITPLAATKIYGSPDPLKPYTVAGLVGGDGPTTVTGELGRGVGENVGGYNWNLGTITGGGNYILALTPGTSLFTVTPKTITYSIGDTSSTYGTLASVGPITYTGLVGTDTLTSVLAVKTQGGTPVTLAVNTAAALYPVTLASYSGTAASNYVLASTGNRDGTLTINKANLLVTIDNLSKLFGSPNPAFVYTATGFVVGETAAALIGTTPSDASSNGLAITTTAGSDSPAGTYPITVTGQLANYNVTVVQAQLTIAPPFVPEVIPAPGTSNGSVSATTSTFSNSTAAFGGLISNPDTRPSVVAAASTSTLTGGAVPASAPAGSETISGGTVATVSSQAGFSVLLEAKSNDQKAQSDTPSGAAVQSGQTVNLAATGGGASVEIDVGSGARGDLVATSSFDPETNGAIDSEAAAASRAAEEEERRRVAGGQPAGARR